MDFACTSICCFTQWIEELSPCGNCFHLEALAFEFCFYCVSLHKKNQSRQAHTKTRLTRLDQARPDKTKLHHTTPNCTYTAPDHIRPHQTRPDQATPHYTGAALHCTTPDHSRRQDKLSRNQHVQISSATYEPSSKRDGAFLQTLFSTPMHI